VKISLKRWRHYYFMWFIVAQVKDTWNISASGNSSTSIAVQWQPYPGQEKVQNFIAVCSTHNNYSNIATATTDRNQSNVVVINLLKNTMYKVEVLAFLGKKINSSNWNETSLNVGAWKSLAFFTRTLEDGKNEVIYFV